MAEPWFCREAPSEGPGWWETFDDVGVTYWPTEKLARRYAALPVMLELARQVVAYSCESYVREDIVISAHAALKAAGEEP